MAHNVMLQAKLKTQAHNQTIKKRNMFCLQLL